MYKEHLVHRDQWDQRDLRDSLGTKDFQEKKGNREKREIKDMQEYLALLGQWGKKETWVYLANQDNKASQGHQAHREHMENKAHRDHKDQQEGTDHQVPRATQDIKVIGDSTELLVPVDQLEPFIKHLHLYTENTVPHLFTKVLIKDKSIVEL